MKKVLIVIFCLMLLVGCGKKKEEESLSGMITIDINPSIEMEINDGNANRINPLDEEARELVDRESMEGKPVEEVFEALMNKVKDKGYVDDELYIILGVEDSLKESFEDLLKEACEKEDIKVNIIVPEITEEAKHEAVGRGVTPAKAAVIIEAMKENEQLHFEDLKDKSAKEILEFKETGLYCGQEYTLRGDKCVKVIKEEKPQEGKSCPKGTYEYKGACYEEKAMEETDKYICQKGYTLNGDKCIKIVTVNASPAKYSCSSGTAKTRYEAGLTGKNDGDAKDIVCVDASKATHPVSPCELNDGTEWTKANGKCYWHRAGKLPSGCPGKIEVNGECWDDASNVLICKGARDGKQYKSRNEYCEGSIKYNKPTVSEYKCNSGYKLSGSKCTKEESIPAEHEKACPTGYKLVNNEKCINENNKKDYETGFICNKDAVLEKDRCVYYEEIVPNS